MMMRLNLLDRFLEFVEEASDELREVEPNESTVLLGDFNADIGNDARVWMGVIGQNGNADVNDNARLLLQQRYENALRIIDTLFKDRYLHKYTRCRDFLGQRSLIDFCIVSADLFHSVLDVRVKRCVELLTDHHLVICNLHSEKPTGATQTFRARRSYLNKAGGDKDA